MVKLTVTLAATALFAGAAFAQADNTNCRVVQSGVPVDVYEAGPLYPGHVYDPRYSVERPSTAIPTMSIAIPTYIAIRTSRRSAPLTPHQAETVYGYPYPYSNETPSWPPAWGAGKIGAQQDSNPNDFTTGIYNPKP